MVRVHLPVDQSFHCSQKGWQATTHPNNYADAVNCISERVMRHSRLLFKTELDCKVPTEEETTGDMSVLLAQLVAVLATEVEVEAAKVVVAKGTIPVPIVCLSVESMSLIPSTVSPQMNGTSLATMAENRFSVCATAPTVSNLPLVETEAVKEEAGVVRLQP